MRTGDACAPRHVIEPADAVVAESFEVFYLRMFDGMIRLACAVLADTSAAEDVVQEAFARVYSRYRALRTPEPYLRSVVLNACRAATRKKRTAIRYRSRAASSGSIDPVHDDVLDAIRKLPSRRRDVIVLRFYLGLSVPEIAASMRIPTGTVKSLLHRGLTQLRKELGDA